jgi:hypothetical protein
MVLAQSLFDPPPTSVKPFDSAREATQARRGDRFRTHCVRTRHYLNRPFNPRDEAFAAPKLNRISIDKASRLLDGFVVVNANQRFETFEIAIGPDGVCSVIGNGVAPRMARCHASRSARYA